MSKTLDILVLYVAIHEYPLRESSREHIFGFSKCSDHRFYYWNIAVPRPDALFYQNKEWDGVILVNLIGYRMSPVFHHRWAPKIEWIKELDVPRLLLCQDEYVGSQLILDFAKKFGITKLFSLASEKEQKKIYGADAVRDLQIEQTLPGYLGQDSIKEIIKYSCPLERRPIDIGYRSRKPLYSLGRHGKLKADLTDQFQKAKEIADLRVDLSNKPEDTLFGTDWFRFLGSCKYTLGVEGGSSIHDPDGRLWKELQDYQWSHPHATYEEAEQAVLQGQDGSLNYFAISPRHLEAVFTKTCQILIEGDYNGILQAWRHYIPLKKDFSNLAEVLDIVRKDELRKEIVKNAYNDLLNDTRIQLSTFVQAVTRDIKKKAPKKEMGHGLVLLNRAGEAWSSAFLFLYTYGFAKPFYFIKKMITCFVPEKNFQKLVDRLRAGRAS